MSSLIQELQADAINSKSSISELLSKAKVVAVKLNLDEFLKWIEKEIKGYDVKDEIPSYRSVSGEIKLWNPYHGWQPIVFGNPKIQEILSERNIGQPIAELQDLLERKGDTNYFFVTLPADIEETLREGLDIQPPDIKLLVDHSQVSGIIDAVRNKILDWALRLEQSGIMGDGLSFSSSDKEKAEKVKATYHIENISNFAGVIGSVSEKATINIKQINKENISELREITNSIKKYLDDIKIENSKKQELEIIADNINKELDKETLEPPKVNKLLSSAKNILEGAAGGVIAQGIISAISQFVI